VRRTVPPKGLTTIVSAGGIDAGWVDAGGLGVSASMDQPSQDHRKSSQGLRKTK
jgi:hypothetical protein